MDTPLKHTQILWCHCRDGNISAESHNEIRDVLIDSGLDTIQVPDLCGATANHALKLQNAIIANELIVIGCYPRAMRALLHSVGISGKKSMRFINQKADKPEKIREILARISDNTPSDLSSIMIDDEDNWIPWYPVIDRDRCKNCGQCASFCLFGVYEEIDGETRVKQPKNCKTNCPACARICPEAAIIFPKYEESPINGAEITNEDDIKARIKINVDEILGDDVYAALAERRKKARSLKLRREAIGKAKTERSVHLKTEDVNKPCACTKNSSPVDR